MTSIVSAREISKHFGTVVAVDRLSLDLNAGECLALLGPNGAGKTTTIEMLCGLQTPDSGQVHLFGEDLHRNRRRLMQKVGLVMQETSLYKKLKVRETFELFASFYDVHDDPKAILAKLQLTDKAESRLEHLSGGQKQRVYLGCGIINKPQLVFLDEPTTGLDPQARHSIWDFVRDLKREGCAIILTTHYMEEAEALAERVAIIDHGRIIAAGRPIDLIAEHCGGQVLWFSAALDDKTLSEQLALRLSWFRNPKPLNGGIEVSVQNAAVHIAELIDALRATGGSLTGLEMRAASLEDVFLRLTGRSMRDA